MSLPVLVLFFLSILANLGVQFFMKLGATNLGKINFTSLGEYTSAFTKSPELLLGMFCALVAAIAYFFSLTQLDLSLAGPASALIYVFSLLLGRFYFGESIVTNQYMGLGLIVFGVILVSSK